MIVRLLPPYCFGAPGWSRMPGHDADAEVDVVRRIGIELDEIGLGDLGLAGRSFQAEWRRSVAPGSPRRASSGSARLCPFFAKTRLVATSRMSDGARSTRCRKRSCSFASSTRLESMAETTSSSFSCDVTTIQAGAMIFLAFSKFLPTLPNSSTTARRSSILSPLRATCWPTSSMTKTRAFPGRRRPTSSKHRSTTLLTVIAVSRFRWECVHESAVV